MDYTQYGNQGTQATGPATGQSGCGCSTSGGPTPSPFPPSPMMPGPSMQTGGFGGAPGTSTSMGPVQGGPQQGSSGHAGCSTGSSQPGAAGGMHSHPGTFQSAYMHHPPLHEAYHHGYYPPGAAQQYAAPSPEGYSFLGLNLSDGNFWKGALIGAAVTLLITNETVQRTIMMGVAKAYSAAQDGVGEIKEMFEDAQAELRKPEK